MLHIDCILVFIVYFLFVFLYHSLMNEVAQGRYQDAFGHSYKPDNLKLP